MHNFRFFFTSLFKEWLHIRKRTIVKGGRENIKFVVESPSLAFWSLKLKDHVFWILNVYSDTVLAPPPLPTHSRDDVTGGPK